MNTADMNRVRKAIENPELAVNHLRMVLSQWKANVRGLGLHRRTERFSCAERLAGLLGEETDALREYHREVYADPALKTSLFDRFYELHEEVGLSGNTSTVDAEILYVLCRALEPDTVIETGVLYGAYDAYILAALDENGRGQLHSIDLPEAPSEQFDHGHLIPEEYRDRWHLHLGDVRDVLDGICAAHRPDVFLHDSEHTKRHMRWEYETAYGYLPDGGVLASHDVLASDVFRTFAAENDMPWVRVNGTGVAVKREG